MKKAFDETPLFYLIRHEFANEAKYEDIKHHRCKYHDVCYYGVDTLFMPFLKK